MKTLLILCGAIGIVCVTAMIVVATVFAIKEVLEMWKDD